MKYIKSILYTFFVFIAYDYYLKDLPFHYITQSKYSLCKKNDVCTRISCFVMSIIVYICSVYFGRFAFHLNLENTLITSNKSNFFLGSFIGTFIPIIDFLFTLILRFIQINKFRKILLMPILFKMFLTAVAEEIIYRGILIGFLLPYIPAWIALITSSILFSYGHLQYSWMYALSAFSGGILFGLAFLKYGIYCAIGFHMFFNFVETTLYSTFDITCKNKTFSGERKTPDDGGIMTFLIEIILLIFFFIFLL